MGKQIPKMSARVVNAIRSLREVHGSTSKEIMNYIMAQHDGSESTIQRQMHAALKRGLEYGILKKANGHYSLNTEADLSQVAPVLSPVERRGRRRRRRSRRRGKRRRSRRRRSRRGRRRRSRSRGRARTMKVSKAAASKATKSRKAREAHQLRNSPVEFSEAESRMAESRRPDESQHEMDEATEEHRRSRSRRRSQSRSRTRSRSRAKSIRDNREE